MKNNEKRILQPSKRTFLLGAAVGSAFLLTGCPALFVGGVALGAAVAFDRRSAGAQADDPVINVKVAQDLSTALEGTHINVNSYNRRVLLTGEVRSAEQKAQAEAIAGKVSGVREVINALAIGPNTSMGSRSNDTYLTGKVKTAITGVDGVSAGDVKVITERSVVYLMGLLTASEAALVSGAVATVGGVRQVVRVFEIITEEELRRMQERVVEQAEVPPDSNPGG